MFAHTFKMVSYHSVASLEELANVTIHIRRAQTKGKLVFDEPVGKDAYGLDIMLSVFVSEQQVCFVYQGDGCRIVECASKNGGVLGALESYLTRDANKLQRLQLIIPHLYK